MKQIAVTAEDVEKVRSSAYKTKDRYRRQGFSNSEDMDLLIEFCDVLLGADSASSVDGFLNEQDVEV